MAIGNRFLTMLRELLAEYFKIQSYRWQSKFPEIVDDYNHLAVRIHSSMEWTTYVSSLGPHLHEVPTCLTIPSQRERGIEATRWCRPYSCKPILIVDIYY